MNDQRMPDFLRITTETPGNGLKLLSEDLLDRLQRNGVSRHMIKGVQIAMGIAYTLGEKNGEMKVIAARDGPDNE